MICGGLSYSFFKRLTANSNEYAKKKKSTMDGRYFFAGSAWKNITVEEMIRFHGMVLKMSIDDRKLGGYEAYFTEGMSINLGRNYSVTLTDYPAWASKVTMEKKRRLGLESDREMKVVTKRPRKMSKSNVVIII